MSIKIYEGYRFPLSKLKEGLAYFKKLQLEQVKGVIVASMALRYRGELSFQEVVEDLSALRCGLNFWVHNHKVYLIPYGVSCFDPTRDPNMMYQLLDSVPNWIEEFLYEAQTGFYQNNGITEKQYKLRKKAWEKVCLGDTDGTRWDDFRCNLTTFSGKVDAVATKIWWDSDTFKQLQDERGK